MKIQEYRGINFKIEQDEALNPREDWDNLSTMACFHPKYNLGDNNHGYTDPHELIAHLIDNKDKYVFLSLYLYDHSGISISAKKTYPYTDRFDSMMVGFIYAEIDSEEVKEWAQSWKDEYHKGKTDREIMEQVLLGEVETYNQFLTGDVYYYSIDISGDSCGGFYGSDFENNGLMDEVRSSIDIFLKDSEEKENKERLRAVQAIKSTRAYSKRKKAVRVL